MTKGSEYCSKIIKIEFNKPISMTKKNNEDFESYAVCWICKKKI